MWVDGEAGEGETKITDTQFQDLDPSILQFGECKITVQTVASILRIFVPVELILKSVGGMALLCFR